MKSTDEDGHEGYVFTDKQGRTVLTRQMNGTTAHDTYYIYDDYGNLCFVLQPMYQSNANPGLYAFQYKYDERNRCIYKHIKNYYDDLILTKVEKGNKAAYIQALIDSREQESLEPFREFM